MLCKFASEAIFLSVNCTQFSMEKFKTGKKSCDTSNQASDQSARGIQGWEWGGRKQEPTDFVVDAALQVAHIHPALLLLHLWVVVQNLVPQPRQVIYTQLVLLSCRWRKRGLNQNPRAGRWCSVSFKNYWDIFCWRGGCMLETGLTSGGQSLHIFRTIQSSLQERTSSNTLGFFLTSNAVFHCSFSFSILSF